MNGVAVLAFHADVETVEYIEEVDKVASPSTKLSMRSAVVRSHFLIFSHAKHRLSPKRNEAPTMPGIAG